MNHLLENPLSGYSFLIMTIVIVSMYLLLRLIHHRLPMLALGAAAKRWVENFSRRILLFYVPTGGLIILTLFWLMSPFWNGIFLLLLIAIFFALGIFIMTADGVQYFSYTHIQQKGFSLVSDNDTKEYCYINIHPIDQEITKQTPQNILFRLLQVPYLDPSFQPTFIDNIKENRIQIKVLLRPGGHKKEIIDLIETWHYRCTLSY